MSTKIDIVSDSTLKELKDEVAKQTSAVTAALTNGYNETNTLHEVKDMRTIGEGGVTAGDAIRNTFARVDADVTAQSNRITNLASLSAGSTTGDAELIDIRVGADGTSYPSAGDAVRRQVNKVNESIEALSEEVIREYSEEWFNTQFALYRGDNEYGYKLPLWDTSHTSVAEKIGDNAGLVAQMSTSVVHGQDDYDDIMGFRTWDVNAYVDDEGNRHVTAIKGDLLFKDTGAVDVFVLGMTYYEKTYVKDGYVYYIRRFSPKEGFIPCRQSVNRDGSISPYFLCTKYLSSDVNGILYSTKDAVPAYYPFVNISYNNGITLSKKKGKYYSLGASYDYAYLFSTWFLKYGNVNSQSIAAGCSSYWAQCKCSVAESGAIRVVIPTTQAGNFPVGASVSVGSNSDRNATAGHNICKNVKILEKVAIDDSNTALVLDSVPFNTTTDSYVTSIHWRSGFSDDVKGRCGCPCQTTAELTNGKFPIVFQGVEFMVGCYETMGNTIMNIPNATGKREMCVCHDATKLLINANATTPGYIKSKYAIQPTIPNAWNYVTRFDFDTENGIFVQTEAGASGSGASVSYGDAIYADGDSSGQREVLLFGLLYDGSFDGLAYLYANSGLGLTNWGIGCRLSINCVGGELSA